MRHSKDTKKQANILIEQMRKGKIASFHENLFGLQERALIEDMIRYAKSLHKIAENQCNGIEYKGMIAKETNLEKKILEIAKHFNLTVVFEGDPRGYVVKLHTPQKDIYNTWGGAETGYGIG